MKIAAASILFFLVLGPCQVSLAQNSFTAGQESFVYAWLSETPAGGSPEAQLAKILVAKQHDPAQAKSLLEEALEDRQPSTLLLSAAVYHCDRHAVASFCDTPRLVEELIRLDPDNLEPRLYLYDWYAETGDLETAFEVLEQGLSEALVHDEYYFRKVAVVLEVLDATGYPGENLYSVSETYASPFSLYARYNRLLVTCREQAQDDTGRIQTCLDLGIRLGNSGRSLLAGIFGGSILREVLNAVKADQELVALVDERRTWDDRVRDLAARRLDWWSDPDQYPQQYRQDLQNMPEREALLRALLRAR